MRAVEAATTPFDGPRPSIHIMRITVRAVGE